MQEPIKTSDRGFGLLLTMLAAWLALAIGLASSDVLRGAPGLIALSIAIPIVAWGLLYAAIPPVRRAIDGLSLRTLILVHSLRVFGVLFLVYSGRGLEPAWAVPAAWADIVVAVLAVPVALYATPPDSMTRWRLAMGWNILAIIDIVAAPVSGLLVAQTSDTAMEGMTRLPLYVIPAVFVPTMILTHVVITARLLKMRDLVRASVAPAAGGSPR